MRRIERITFENTLPAVFRQVSGDSAIQKSDVWQSRCIFSRPGRYIVEAASGTGKSTMCSFIYGNRHDYDGTILFDSTYIRSFSIGDWCELRRRHLALLPQEMRLFPEITVRENIMLKNRLTDYRSEEEIRRMLGNLGILEKYDVPARLLSIGQQQRVAIVRALCQPFDFILLDEPVSHLDRDNNRIAAEMIMSAARQQDAAIISTSVGNPLMLSGGDRPGETLVEFKL